MTMDKDVGDLKDADLHVREGAIVAIGQKLNAPGATVIDGRGMIVLPGLIETHWHMWNTLLRGMSGEKPDYGYFRTTAMLGRVFEPGDMYQGTRLAAAEAINSGITFVHDWCHNVRSPQFAREDLRALKESGLRARFSYGTMAGQDPKQPLDLADIEKLKNEWAQHSNDGLITLGMAWRGHGGNQPTNAVPETVWRAEYEAAQRLGLPISVHSSGSKAARGQIGGLSKAGMIKNVQVIHAVYATDEEIAAMKAAGSSISLAPTSELRIGFGIPPTTALPRCRHPGRALGRHRRARRQCRHVRHHEDHPGDRERPRRKRVQAERAARGGAATIEGARSMGIDDKVGSLKAGKRADIIMIDTRAANLGVFGDPAVMLVTAVQPANVDTVLVDGRILKRNGKLAAMNVALIAKEAAEANAAVRKRANWW